MKKKYLTAIGLIIAAIVTMCGVMIPKQAEGTSNTKQQIGTTTENTQLLYAPDGRKVQVLKEDVEKWVNVGWYKEPVMYVYAPNDKVEIIYKTDLNTWKSVGWYEYPVLYLYALDGRVAIVGKDKAKDWIKVGWYEKIPVNFSRNPFEKTNLSAEQLEKCLDYGLKGYGQAFFEMEQKYGVNAIFAISVAELESGSGTSYSFKYRNNAFGIGPKKSFSSVQEGINFFGQLMNKPLYKGKAIDQIGSIYCVGGNWANKVKNLIEQNYQQL